MSDLISRQAAIKAIDDLPNCYNGFSDTYDKACIIGVLEELPTIDPVKRGKWICVDGKYYCSECDEEQDWKTYYCSGCGANMDDDWKEPEINPCSGCDDYDWHGGCKSHGGCGAERSAKVCPLHSDDEVTEYCVEGPCMDEAEDRCPIAERSEWRGWSMQLVSDDGFCDKGERRTNE